MNRAEVVALAKAVGGSGGGGGTQPLSVTCTLSGGVLTANKTWKEIHDALLAGKNVVLIAPQDSEIFSNTKYVGPVTMAYYSTAESLYRIESFSSMWTDNENGYPYNDEM